MSWFDLLLLPENVLWAWRKVRRAYRTADSLFDQAEVAAFELDLEAQLDSIRNDFATGVWTTMPLRLVPQPKKPDKDGHPRLRQYFQVSVRDQVAWCALVNVLGPELDQKMPAWSYGNRLYRAAWYEREPGDARPSRLNIGPYRHSAGHLYRHFKHSWPLFRRHISLSARKMVADDIDPDALDHGERLALEQSDGLAYLDTDHWLRPKDAGDTIYAASFDLRKFYPSVRTAAILRGFEVHVQDFRDDERLPHLVAQMLAFKVDTKTVSADLAQVVDPPVVDGPFDGIPTGLFVGGFLANVAMLTLDLEIDALLLHRRDVAHFRFVDDHEVLAYDFAAVVAWIRDYARLLRKHDIGPEIEPDKYIPAQLKWILDPDAQDAPNESAEELIVQASRAAAVNGRKPSELMTRTLAQVSMLAAIDFDLLTDSGRERLEQLEWLLLANIPENEIRGDTRMAFAAARIAKLTPALFRPNDELLEAERAYRLLPRPAQDDENAHAAIAALEEVISELSQKERDTWDALLKRHFGLLFEAFARHPDKVRLWIRLIDFCRVTGHNGFDRMTAWLREQEVSDHQHLSCYLGALALQTLSRHVITASVAATRVDALHREQSAAKHFLAHVAASDITAFAATKRPVQAFQAQATRAFVAASVMASEEIINAVPGVAQALMKCASKLDPGRASPSIKTLSERGSSLGVWYHWFFTASGAYGDFAPSYWPRIAACLDATNVSDWNALRRYPKDLPRHAWARLGEHPALLNPDDAGWLLDAARGNLEEFAGLPDSPMVAEIQERTDKLRSTNTLCDWVSLTATLKPNDPRRSEWTALEIIRQILKPLFSFDQELDLESRDADFLDILHPENVQIPPEWRFLPDDPANTVVPTWEGWRKHVRVHEVRVTDTGLGDYRYREILPAKDRAWPRRLRPIGQLLWGILRGSFALPAAWNVRGQERGLVELVAWDLERLPISSFSLAILQSCLLPRNRETSLFDMFPSLFGKRIGHADNDTEFDQPILSPEQLSKLIERAQAILQLTQITVLEHDPRQLIPVRLRQLGAFEGEGDAIDTDVPQ
ncbi:hypothetical protein GRI62_00825 [Erythrobacter arachoides]|uniref:Reverse transcriptase domain-containing protein n=1 Tax=Aurantiacibacter arachoides TaxID=1850444 RepID=A0A844ZWN0_9SPHN|nr:RNA-directed DNA polymerase [Aurantiacibacter arachoides]MXO92148.1 hypothetical protein [Aurantiacibacter arachoides]GGD59320.1 hypothetical protein GCM10011411_19410 [Aurantiacibacter arachoides]